MPPRPRLTRREALLGGLTAAGGALLSGCSSYDLPPTYGNVLRMGDALTYAAHRTLLPGQSLVREYGRADISSFPAIGTTDPGNAALTTFNPAFGERYAQLRAGGFADWRLEIAGKVARPGTYSLADLKRMPARTQITRHLCEEGWSAIAEWTGVPLGHVLQAAGILPSARYVTFHTFDHWTDNIDMLDALHPQTILAYGMNGGDLPVPHGGPVRLRVETQVGYKSLKFLRRLLVHDEFDDLGKDGSMKNGWSWYAGI
jgi:DMSO/TMAO reductase YedYZ molybdopterin-dependent catalytic subunit